MSDPYSDVPAPLAARIPAPALVLLLVVAAPLLLAIFVFRWPWWGDVLAPIVVFAALGVLGNRYDAYQTAAWIRRHPEVMAKKPLQ
jgi:pilus assembly protein TadC